MPIWKQQQAGSDLNGLDYKGDSSRAASLLVLLRRWRRKNAHMIMATGANETRASDAVLASLAGGELAERFHSWRGRSGRRYICSVFPIDMRDSQGGLPDFHEAVIIAVKTGGDGNRHVVGFYQSEQGVGATACRDFVTASVAAGARQWHIHLLTADPQKRRAAIEDIGGLCRPAAPALELV